MNILAFNAVSDYIKREILHKCKLNLSQTRILLFFDSTNNRALTMGTLAKSMNISLSTLSRQLQQKSTKDLIVISKSDNSSSKSVNLNQAGLAKVTELKSALKDIEQDILSKIATKDQQQFISDLRSLNTVDK